MRNSRRIQSALASMAPGCMVLFTGCNGPQEDAVKDWGEFFKVLGPTVCEVATDKELKEYYEERFPPAHWDVAVGPKGGYTIIDQKQFNGHIRLRCVDIQYSHPDCHYAAGIMPVNSDGRLFAITWKDNSGGQKGCTQEECALPEQKSIWDNWLVEQEAKMKKKHPTLEATFAYISGDGTGYSKPEPGQAEQVNGGVILCARKK